MRRISETVGRDEMVEVLAHSSDERALRLLEMILDPVFRRHSFGKLCEKAGLNHTGGRRPC